MHPGITRIQKGENQHGVAVPNNRGGYCPLCSFLKTLFLYCCRFFQAHNGFKVTIWVYFWPKGDTNKCLLLAVEEDQVEIQTTNGSFTRER